MTYLGEQQNKHFLGTGERNKAGVSLQDFLEAYDPSKYMNPCNTVDTLVFTYTEEARVKKIDKLLLIKRGNHPSIGWWALPGGFVEYREDLDKAALRELYEETKIKDIEVEQLKSYGDYDRDPRTRIITTAYVAVVPEGRLNAVAGDDAKEAGWFSIDDKLLSRECNNNLVTEKHMLILSNEDHSVTTTTDITVTYKEKGILQQKKYHVDSTNLLAADHGAVILEGYHYLLKHFTELRR
ncbi:MAG: NUDIX hydrolase [Eubacteriales bacterium]|nr:NUDIX hydrolase [Eubacteriales bacterium]